MSILYLKLLNICLFTHSTPVQRTEEPAFHFFQSPLPWMPFRLCCCPGRPSTLALRNQPCQVLLVPHQPVLSADPPGKDHHFCCQILNYCTWPMKTDGSVKRWWSILDIWAKQPLIDLLTFRESSALAITEHNHWSHLHIQPLLWAVFWILVPQIS